jgi:RNA polymerase sigma-70 factor (ECF subfamily)
MTTAFFFTHERHYVQETPMLSSAIPSTSCPLSANLQIAEDDFESIARRRHELTTLVITEKNAFLRAATSILRNSTDAEDIVHSAFCSAWKAIASFRGEAALKTWFTRIVTNTALMALRKERTNRTVFLEDNPEYLRAFERSTSCRVDDPERIAVRQETLSVVERHIESLPQETRIVITLHFTRDYDIETIARMRGKTRPSVVAHLHRGKALLRKKVKRTPATRPGVNPAIH